MLICDSCRRETDTLLPITLDGTDDFYNLEVCTHCYERLNDYFSPEDVDKMFK